MAVVTKTLTINAAFLREIKEDNRRLHELLDEASTLAARAVAELIPARRLVDTLGELRDQLALHFSLEEAYGYFEDAVQAAPQISEQAEELRSQHGRLFLSVCQIVDEAEQWLYREAAREVLHDLGQRFTTFLHDFRQHESREADLILDAFENDVGVGD
jgi:hypothetical protein